MSDKQTWKNRIIGHDELSPDQLLANPLNFRIHPSAQQSALSGSLDSLGWIQEVLVNQNTGHVIDGHLRIQLALRNDEKLIPVTYLDLTEDEERLALLSLDPIAAMAATDKEQLETLLSQVNSDDQRVQEFLSNLAKESGLTYGEQEQGDAEPQIDKAEELQKKWGVQTGDLYSIGSHKLLCGDSTLKDDVERVMGGEKARMIFTDPPYNVSYQDNESIDSLKARNRRTDGLVVSNDTMTDNEFDNFLIAFMGLFPIDKGGTFYLCAPAGRPETQFRNALNCVSGLSLRECIVWVKNIFVFGRQDYHWRHESILYGWKDGAAHYFIDDHTQDTVWEIERPRVSEEHPTMKPVELPSKAIANSSMINEIVFDGFCGSGTTMVACQNLSRKCRAIEISPKYCAVILQRMTDAFPGIIIEKVESV